MAKVELDNISIHYPVRIKGKIQKETKKAITGLSLTVRDGDRLGISGPNGSGKSSLLRVIAGVQPPSHGQIRTEGTIGSMLSIAAGFHPKASGEENITHRGRLLGLSVAEINSVIEDASETFGLSSVIRHPLETYSSGMKMKLSFAMATTRMPEILVMDEWMSVGDKAFKRIAADRMEKVFHSAGLVVFASHSEKLLENFSTRRIDLPGQSQ